MYNSETLKIDDAEYIHKDRVLTPRPLSGEVLVRTTAAGVHIGTLESRSGQVVTLTGARRLWQWRGAFTLNEVAVEGVTRSGSRISKPVPSITLLTAIEIIPVAQGVDLSTTEK